jgi:hypothetical protein
MLSDGLSKNGKKKKKKNCLKGEELRKDNLKNK